LKSIAVDCLFLEDGTVRVRRIRTQENWLSVEQGRQWQDDIGRHLLIMFGNGSVQEILLRKETLIWELAAVYGSGTTVV